MQLQHHFQRIRDWKLESSRVLVTSTTVARLNFLVSHLHGMYKYRFSFSPIVEFRVFILFLVGKLRPRKTRRIVLRTVLSCGNNNNNITLIKITDGVNNDHFLS